LPQPRREDIAEALDGSLALHTVARSCGISPAFRENRLQARIAAFAPAHMEMLAFRISHS
jgi:hypothetical protein